MSDIIGEALLDFQNGICHEDIKTYSSLDEEDIIPVPYLFRSFEEMPKLEQLALEQCSGSVLDIGCGAGSHSLYLQKKGFNIVALDVSRGAINVCKARGIKKAIQSDVLNYAETKFDTLLLVMNGIGIVGNLSDLGKYLDHFKKILNPEGQILLDSSNIIYMFEPDDDGGYWIPDTDTYYGEVTFQMSYKKLKGVPFQWLYIDLQTLKIYAKKHGFHCELVSEGEHFDYLAKLSLIQ